MAGLFYLDKSKTKTVQISTTESSQKNQELNKLPSAESADDKKNQKTSKKSAEKNKKSITVESPIAADEAVTQNSSLLSTLKGGKDSQSAGPVCSVSVSSKYIAVVRKNDNYVRLWKSETVFESDKRHVMIPTGSLSDHATCCDISHDEKYLVFGLDYPNTIVIYDISNEKSPKKVSKEVDVKEKKPIKQVRFTSDGKFVLTISEGSDEILVRRVPSSEIVHRFTTSHLQVFMFDMKNVGDSIDSSKQVLSCASFTSMLKIFNARVVGDNFEISKEFTELKGHSSSILSVSFHPSEQQIATVSQDGTLKIFTTMSMKDRVELHRTSKAKVNVDDVILFDRPVPKIVNAVESVRDQTQFVWVKFVSDKLLAALCENRRAVVFMKPDIKAKKLSDVRVIDHLTSTNSSITSIAAWKGQYIVTGDSQGIVRIWKADQ